MLAKLDVEELSFVLQLLDQFLHQKQVNRVLTGWKMVKENWKNSKKGRKRFLQHPRKQNYQRVKRENPQSQQSIENVDETKKGYKITKQEDKTMKISNTFSGQSFSAPSFEDYVLKRLQKMEQSLQIAKSSTNSRSRNESESQNSGSNNSVKEIIKFNLNAKYIPIRNRMQKYQSYISEVQNVPIYSNCENLQNFQEYSTPRIGPKVQIKKKGQQYAKTTYDFENDLNLNLESIEEKNQSAISTRTMKNQKPFQPNLQQNTKKTKHFSFNYRNRSKFNQ